MTSKFALIVAATLLAAPAFADSHAGSGDPEAGEDVFKKCKACHSVTADDGTAIVKGGKVGPNLYGIAGRTAGAVPGFKGYSSSMAAAGEKAVVWDEVNFVKYVQDPSGFLKEATGDDGAKSKMAFKLNKGMEDVYAYLASVGPS
ncbi:c-type cytochrome [Pseudogemmobacter sp. W21_MBD1_M6]|uniref:c-type cytochrome n=1 Tax=Pseudogemmobacter sp. W21_MBD1_M6 TaxID=3240271 RepID=UPI003F96FEC5